MSLEIEFRNNTTINLDKFIKDKSISKKIEESIYKFTTDYTEHHGTPFLFESIYQNKLNEILRNLDDKSDNKTLLENIKKGTINPEQLAYLKPEELDPDKYEPIIKKKELEEYKKNNKATTDIFKCSKCKSRKSTVHQQQTRAGDEPMTTYVTCQECGHVFKF